MLSKRIHLIVLKKVTLLALSLLLPFLASAAGIIENKGQIRQSSSEQILFYTSVKGGTVYFLKDRIAFVLNKETEKTEFNNTLTGSKINVFRYDYKITNAEGFKLETGDAQPEKLNFYSDRKHFSARQFNKIIYKNVSAGVSLVFYNHPGAGLKYDIVFDAPRKKEVEFSFELIGASAKKGYDKTTSKETLILETPLGEVTEHFPLVYADIRKGNKLRREEKACRISIENNIVYYSAEVPVNCQSLVIDPWTSFAGGGDADESFGSDGDSYGNVYISGYTLSVDFPSSPGAFQTGLNANYDAFIFKFDPTGQRVWATYYGGSQNDFGYRLKVTPSGKPTLAGYTYSSDLFISPSGVFSSSFSGSIDAFITQFDSGGNFLWGTFAGGTGGDFAISMDMDKQGNLALGGFTSSSDFPVSGSAWQLLFGGALDCFVAKFDSTGNRLWATYLGGMNSEDAHAIKFDTLGNVYVGGDTYSSDFPVDAGSYQNFLMGGSDAFLAKYDPSGNKLWATYLGGVGNEDIYALANDRHNNIYLTGYCSGYDFPVTPGAFQSTMNGVRDLTIGSFNPSGNLRWLTYAGGVAWDAGKGIIVNTNQKITVCGETNSTDFPIVGNKYDTVHNGGSDICYLQLDTTGSVELSNLKGGSNSDYAHDICEVMQQKIVVSGSTYSVDFPVTPGVFQTIKGADVDAFVWLTDSTSIITGFSAGSAEPAAYLYPNPANDQVILQNLKPGNYTLMLFDASGRKLTEEKYYSGDILITGLEELPNGVYSILLISNSKSTLYKLVKLD